MASEVAFLAVDGSVRGRPLAALGSLDGAVLDLQQLEGDAGGMAAAIGAVLSRHGGELVAAVGVRGPGSYIGVRGGLAGALGVAQGRGLPLILVGALEVVANQADCIPGQALAVTAAGRGGVYAQLVRGGERGGWRRWRADSPAYVLSATEAQPEAWAGLAATVGESEAGWAGLVGREMVPQTRSRLEALCLVAASSLDHPTGYDQVSADYGRQLGGGE